MRLQVFVSLLLLGCAAPPAEQDDVPESVRNVTQALGLVGVESTTYAVGVSVLVGFARTDTPTSLDWVAISAEGSPATSFERWAYTGGAAVGERTFVSPPVGSYVVRLYDNNSYRILAESRPFSIVASAAAAINVDQASYSTTGTITASYSGMHGFDHDWIALAQEGAAPTSFERWTYTGGVLSGSATFAAAGLYGRYVARAYFDDGFTIAAESAPFDVNVAQPPVLTTDAPAYTTGATATIAYSGMAGARTDWIAIAKQGSPVTSYLAWAYTYGALTGTVSFPLATIAPSPGAYVARAFFADSFVLQAEAPFTVVSSPVPSGITCTGRQGIATLTETNVRVTARLIVGGPGVYQPYLSIDSSLARAFFGCPQGCPMLVASSVNIPTTTFRSAFFEQPGSGVLGGIELLAPNHPSVTESSTATVDVHWMRSAVEVWCSGTTNLIH